MTSTRQQKVHLRPVWERLFHRSVCSSAWFLILALLAQVAYTEGPHVYAIKDARIVTVTNGTLPKGTVVFRDGLIEAVGERVEIPADAWIINGSALTVYPGLIDAHSDLGIEQPQPARGPSPGGGQPQQPAPPPSPQIKPGMNANRLAVDQFRADESKLEKVRGVGITTALTVARTGVLQGQSALINLAGEKPTKMIVKSPVALHVKLSQDESFRVYPGSLMGVIAYIRQTLLDTQHYGLEWNRYQNVKRGVPRPEPDKDLEALRPVIARQLPVIFTVEEAKDIRSIIKLAEEFNLKYIISGASEGYAVADLLRDKQVPVLVSLNFPKQPRDADPEADVPLRTLRLRAEAPRTPGALYQAGVKFAFASGFMSDPKDFIKNVAKAIKAGLPEAEAIKALTLNAAEMLGVAEQLGSVEVGKIANLVVTDGDLFNEKTRIQHLFIDGREIELKKTPEKPSPSEGSPAVDVSSTWNLAVESPQGPLPVTATLQQSGTRITGSISSMFGNLAQGQQSSSGGAILIQNATIMTVTRGTIQNGSVLIRDGKIAAVGERLKAPANAQIIDAAGKYVIPGIIDCHSHIAIDGGVNEGTLAVTAMVRIEDVLDPVDIDIYRDLAGGVTTANVLHGSANPIGGQNSVIKLRWGKTAKEMVVEGAPPGIKFALGENPKRSNFNAPGVQQRSPATRMGVEYVIREAFTEARAYMRKWDEYKQQSSARNGDSPNHVLPPKRDLKLETLAEVLRGERMVHAHCYRADEILMLIRLAEEFGFKIATFQHVLEGYKVAKEIAAHGAGASTFSDWWAYKVEAYDAIPYNAAIMTRKGVLVSLNSDSAELARRLNLEAAKAVKYGGLTEDEALALVTINPAKQLRIDKRVGSIEVGKDADLVIFSGHPLSVYSIVEKVFIDGQVYFDRPVDLARRADVEKEKKALKEKLKPEREGKKEAEKRETEEVPPPQPEGEL
ncbi:MAG: amidohydrolase family protein [Acidobacteria bacterium]|nr:amidohydrolase family protein [Acidobacteriota bacterium]